MLAVGLLYCLIGALIRSPLLILLGQIPIVILVGAIFLYLPGAMALDRRLVQLRLYPKGVARGSIARTSTHVVGDDIELQLEINNETTTTLYGLKATPFASPYLQVDASEHAKAVVVRPESQACMPMTLRAGRAGRCAVQGFDVSIRDPLGLMECIDYLPANHVFQCYPAVGQMRRPNVSKNFIIRDSNNSGYPTRRQAPAGSDVRELRDYHPGEPLRNIAWKASARARKLIARDYESESQCSIYVFLDISGTMRAQPLSDASNKLDLVIEYTADLAQSLNKTRQPLGLITFDERIYAHIKPGVGQSHVRRMLNHLTSLNHIAEPDRSDLDETEIQQLLADYLLVQERLDFRIPKNGNKNINAQLLNRWLHNVLPSELRKFQSAPLNDAVLEPDTITPARQFLQLRAVPVPFRGETRHGLKERSLYEAIELLSKTTRQQLHIILVTDLLAIVNIDLLTRTLKLAKSKGHRIEVLIPTLTQERAANNTETSERHAIIQQLFTATESQDRQKILQHLHAAAIPTRTLS